MMTTKMSCRMNCFICHLSVFRGLVVRLVQVPGVSCVSHDAVRLVPGPRALPVYRAAMKFLNVSLVAAFGLFSFQWHRSLFQQRARGSSLSHAVSPSWSLFPDDSPRCSGAKILNKTASAHGTISCAQSQSHAARTGVMPPAPRAYLVTQNPAYLTTRGQIAESGAIRVLQRFCVSYRRVLSCSPSVRIARSARRLLAELCRGVGSTATLPDMFAFTFSATAMIEGSLSQRNLNLPSNKKIHEVCH